MTTKERKAWVLYMLRCGDGTLYTGITNDLHERFRKHCAGAASRYTRSRLPVTVVYVERCKGKSDALRQERGVKGLARSAKERLIAVYGRKG